MFWMKLHIFFSFKIFNSGLSLIHESFGVKHILQLLLTQKKPSDLYLSEGFIFYLLQDNLYNAVLFPFV